MSQRGDDGSVDNSNMITPGSKTTPLNMSRRSLRRTQKEQESSKSTSKEEAREVQFLKNLTPLTKTREKQISKHIAKYSSADDSQAYKTLLFHTFLWFCTYPLYNYLPTLLWIVLKGAMVVRSFILFHDMTHGSYFKRPTDNRFYGEITALMCCTPFSDWGKNHKGHHDMFGDLSIEKFDGGNTTWFTKQWVDAWPLWKRIGFYIIRDPILVYFWLVPLQWGVMFHFRAGGLSTSIFFFANLYGWHAIYGWAGLVHEAIALCLGASFGIYLFHLQHSVNPAYRVHQHANHDKFFGAMYGSTYLHLHPLVKFFTLGIEYHHIHHISTRVPCYKIQECHETAPNGLWDGIVHVDTLEKWIVSTFHTMWDDDTKSLITFPWYQAILSALGFNEPAMWGKQHAT
jgi:omega-6 fatty acid desaturase (delta-12 desaturase)